MSLFVPSRPVDPMWHHFRRRREALAALFPPMLQGRPGTPSKPSLELQALQRDISRPSNTLRPQHEDWIDQVIPLEWTGDQQLYERVFSEAAVSLDALRVEFLPPYAHDAARVAKALEIAQEAARIAPERPEVRDRLTDMKLVWDVFLDGYGCLGRYPDQYGERLLWTYVVVRGDEDESSPSARRSRRRPKAKIGDSYQEVPRGSRVRGTQSCIQFPVPVGELVQVGIGTNRPGSGSRK